MCKSDRNRRFTFILVEEMNKLLHSPINLLIDIFDQLY